MTTEEALEADTHQDAYKNYADYNGVLRTWFVSFGLGALVLFMLHPDFVILLRGKGHFALIVLLFLGGCFGQIVVALINKFSSWHIYDATKKRVKVGRVTHFFYNAFWIDKAIDLATVGSFLFAIGLMVLDFVVTPQPSQAEVMQPSDLATVSRCSEGAAKAYQRGGFDSKGMDFYKNHWNKKLGKCFIQIVAHGKDNFLSIEVYDVFENRRYASFTGHQVCDVAIVGERACQLDTAQVWLDGNDDRQHGDNTLGFNGLGRGRLGDASTQTDFLDRIRPFMTE